MADASQVSIWAPAIPFLAGGFVTIVSVIAVHLLSHRQDLDKARAAVLREKAEELAGYLLEGARHLSDHLQTTCVREEFFGKSSPLADARVVQELYFPELRNEFIAIRDIHYEISNWITERENAKKAGSELIPKDIGDKCLGMFSRYDAATFKVTNILSEKIHSDLSTPTLLSRLGNYVEELKDFPE